MDVYTLPMRWFCYMNKYDPEHASCSAEEQYNTACVKSFRAAREARAILSRPTAAQLAHLAQAEVLLGEERDRNLRDVVGPLARGLFALDRAEKRAVALSEGG
ncbi:unnamed protein product [Discosporangium mesarthrocarpum]